MGSVAHIMKLAAVAGLKVLGPLEEKSGDQDDSLDVLQANLMAINALVNTPDRVHVDMSSVYKQIHGI